MKTKVIVLSCLTGVVILAMCFEYSWAGSSQVANGKWQMANGKWQMANGKWQVARSDLRRAIGDRRLATGEPSSKIGVVNIQRIFLTCKRNARYEQEAKTEQDKLNAELEKLAAELEAEEAGLRALKPGSSDHMAQVKEILTKRASLQAQQEFYKRHVELKYQRQIEELYKEILQETGEVAQQKGLDLVFVKDEIEFPALSVNDAMMAIRTHKLLYSGGCLDITDEVMARIDAGK